MAVFRVQRTGDYTVMSNHHFKNRELSLKAKGLLSLMLSLPEDWDYTLVGLSVINKEGVDSIRGGLKELERAGYVERKRARNEEGQLKGTEYIIHEIPILEKPMLENPTLDNPTLEKPALEKPTLGNPTQLNTNKTNTKESNTEYIKDLSNLISSEKAEDSSVDNSSQDEIRKDEIEIKIYSNMKKDSYDFWKKEIQNNVEYESLIVSHPYDKKLIDEIIGLMVENILSGADYVQIASGKYPLSLVKEKFLAIDYTHMEYILECFTKNTTKVKNIKQYMKTLIFKATSTIDSYYTAEVHHDMYGY